MLRRLVLLGGGHAHVEVLRRFARRPVTGVECVLVTPTPHHLYSGMVPGVIRGAHEADDSSLDLVALAAAAGARLVLAAAARVDPAARTVTTTDGAALAFDLCSCDVGSAAAGLAATPGAAAHAHALRPIARLAGLQAAVARVLGGPERAPTVCVVGGGAAGVEVALALEAVLRTGGRRPRVALVERAPTLLGGHHPRVRALAGRLLAARGVDVRTVATVAAVDADAVRLADGSAVPSACTVWVAGAAAPAVIADSPLPRDAAGFLRVDATLRAADGAPVWGAGDCVALDDAPWVPRAGVYAVRQGPVLAENLRAALDGTQPRAYRPQRTGLALLDTADDRALLAWRGVALHARWPLRLKSWIDRRWLARYADGSVGTA